MKAALPICPNESMNTNSLLGYWAWHNDAQRRSDRGQRQTYCGTCRRWRWPDECSACRAFVSALAPKEED